MLVFYKYRKNAKSNIQNSKEKIWKFATKDRVHAYGAELLTQKVPQT